MKIEEKFIISPSGKKLKTQFISKPQEAKENSSRSKKCYLFLHDIGEESSYQQQIIQKIKAKSIITFDFAGHGHSDGEKGDFGTFEDVLDDIQAVIKHFHIKNIEIVCFQRSFLFPLFLFLDRTDFYETYFSGIHFVNPKILEQKDLTEYMGKHELGKSLLKDLYIFNKENPIKVKSYLSYLSYYSRLTEPLYFFKQDIHLSLPRDVSKNVQGLFSLVQDSIVNAKVIKHTYNSRQDLIDILS